MDRAERARCAGVGAPGGAAAWRGTAARSGAAAAAVGDRARRGFRGNSPSGDPADGRLPSGDAITERVFSAGACPSARGAAAARRVRRGRLAALIRQPPGRPRLRSGLRLVLARARDGGGALRGSGSARTETAARTAGSTRSAGASPRGGRRPERGPSGAGACVRGPARDLVLPAGSWAGAASGRSLQR